MFNNSVIEVLKQVNNMTDSVILKYPKTVAVSESQDMMMIFDVSALDSDVFDDIGIKGSLSEFLNLMKLFPEERKVVTTANSIDISGGGATSRFLTDNIALMDSINKDETAFDRTNQVPTVSEYVLTPDDIKKIKASTSVFSDLSEVIFTSKDGDCSISLGATNKYNARSNTFSISKQCTAPTTKDYNIKIPVQNFKFLPDSTYTVQVKYNSQRDAYRILFVSSSLRGFKIFMTVKI